MQLFRTRESGWPKPFHLQHWCWGSAGHDTNRRNRHGPVQAGSSARHRPPGYDNIRRVRTSVRFLNTGVRLGTRLAFLAAPRMLKRRQRCAARWHTREFNLGDFCTNKSRRRDSFTLGPRQPFR